MAQSQIPLSVLSQIVQEVQDYSYLVNLIKYQSNIIKELQKTIACLNAKLEASERVNIQGELHENNISFEKEILNFTNMKPKEDLDVKEKEKEKEKTVHEKDNPTDNISGIAVNAAKFSASINNNNSIDTGKFVVNFEPDSILSFKSSNEQGLSFRMNEELLGKGKEKKLQ